MMKKHVSEQEIEDTLNSLDGLQRAEATPFFYTRLKARMEKELGAKGIAGIAWLRPSLAFSVLALFVALNVVTIINKKSAPKSRVVTTNTTVTEQVAQDYDLSISTY
ncbi:MAG: hypothetical protein V4722_04230 [Bacteroidota bacterium]